MLHRYRFWSGSRVDNIHIPCSFSVPSAFPSRSREPSSSASQNVWVFVFLHSDFSSSLISSSLTGELSDAVSNTWSGLSEWTIITDARLLKRSLHQVIAIWITAKSASLFLIDPEEALAALCRFLSGISWTRSFFRFFLHDSPPWKQKRSIWFLLSHSYQMLLNELLCNYIFACPILIQVFHIV